MLVNLCVCLHLFFVLLFRKRSIEMKILPLTIQFENYKSVNRKREYQAVPHLKKDTVNFKGNFLQDAYSNLNTVIDKQILPFINESKLLYKTLVDIQNGINKIISNFSSEEINLMVRKSNYLQPEYNKSLKPYEAFIIRAEKYKQNLNNYNRIKTILSGENYDNDDIKATIQKADVTMAEVNPELIKIKPFTAKYDEIVKNIEDANEKNILANDDKELYQKLIDLKENYAAKVLFYEFKIPLPEALKLVQRTKNVKKELEKPTKSLMHTLKTLEHLQQSVDGIVQQINTYKQSKDEIGNFISDYKNKENKFPTPVEVQKAYKALTQKCDDSAQFHTAKLDEYFEKKYNQQNVNIDFIVLDEFLSTQQKTVETLSAKKKEIDQKYIAENNQNVLKELGYGDSLSN